MGITFPIYLIARHRVARFAQGGVPKQDTLKLVQNRPEPYRP